MNETIMETAAEAVNDVTTEAIENIEANFGFIDEKTVKYILEALGVVAGALVIRWLNKKYKLTTKAKEFLVKLNPFKKKEVESEEGKDEEGNK